MIRPWLLTLAISALVMFVLYRRARRLFGRQKYSVPRLCFRVCLIGLIGVMLLASASVVRGGAPWIGLLVGIVVGLVGITLTRFEFVDGEVYFKPNVYIGLGVLSLLVGRMLYRMTRLLALGETVDSFDGGPASFQSLPASSTTWGILFVVLGFYVCYYLAVLLRGQMLRQVEA